MALLAFDSAPLSSFARAKRLDVLRQLTDGHERVTTRAVLDELKAGIERFPDLLAACDLPWIEVVPVESLEELRLFALYANRLGAGRRDIGEASILAWTEANHAIAFTDDEAAVKVGRSRGVKVYRSLHIVADGLKRAVMTDDEAAALVDELALGGGRFPFPPGGYLPWARERGLL